MNIFTSRTQKNKKGQSAIEYIFVVALALLIIVPGTIIFYQYTQSSQKAIVSSQIYKIGNDMVSGAQMMYSVGDNSWQTIEINFPSTVHQVTIYNEGTGGILVIRHGTDYISDAVFFSRVPLLNSTADESNDCSAGCIIPIHKGYTKIRIESEKEGHVRFRVIA
jgi:hypothetical protein